MKPKLNLGVLEVLQTIGDCTIDELVHYTGWNELQVRQELARQKDSCAGDLILEYVDPITNDSKYHMHSKAKQTPLEILNYFFNVTYQIRKKYGFNVGAKSKQKFKNEMEQEIQP